MVCLYSLVGWLILSVSMVVLTHGWISEFLGFWIMFRNMWYENKYTSDLSSHATSLHQWRCCSRHIACIESFAPRSIWIFSFPVSIYRNKTHIDFKDRLLRCSSLLCRYCPLVLCFYPRVLLRAACLPRLWAWSVHLPELKACPMRSFKAPKVIWCNR